MSNEIQRRAGVRICLPKHNRATPQDACDKLIAAGFAASYETKVAYRRPDIEDLHILSVMSPERPLETSRKALAVLRDAGIRAYRYIGRSGDRQKPSASPKLKLTQREVEMALVAATLDGIKPSMRAKGNPELATYFIQLLHDRWTELETMYGAEHLRDIDVHHLLDPEQDT